MENQVILKSEYAYINPGNLSHLENNLKVVQNTTFTMNVTYIDNANKKDK